MSPSRRFLRTLGGALFGLAIVALTLLLIPDLWNSFAPSRRHQEAGSLTLMLVGASFICVQLAGGARPREMIKGLLLGLAFVLWGSEQFLPPGPAVTAVDGAVIAVFVVDLGLVIAGRLEAAPGADPGKPPG